MLRTFLKLLSLMADVRAVRRGPSAVLMRQARRAAHRQVNRTLR